jgi:hypothetical protein
VPIASLTGSSDSSSGPLDQDILRQWRQLLASKWQGFGRKSSCCWHKVLGAVLAGFHYQLVPDCSGCGGRVAGRAMGASSLPFGHSLHRLQRARV